MFGRSKRGVRVNLALQGGGAHGAFTWGVLDRLLDETSIDFGWISGTSAGAVNAVAFASGLAKGGRAGARDVLRAVWEGVIEAGVPDLLRLNPFLYGMTRSAAAGQVASLFSPYEINPLGFDPLRKLVTQHIDFERLREFPDIELLIAATDVATGRPRLFRRAELTVEAVLASACLPTVHHAVEIDGRAYWDGGFSANPELMTVVTDSPAEDTLIVALNPVEKPSVPRSAREIAFDVNRITFNQPYLRDIADIVALQSEAPRGWLRRGGRAARFRRHRFHLIEAGRHTGSLSPETKMRPDRAVLTQLHHAGREETRRWIGRTAGQLGKASTVDLAAKYLSPLAPLHTPGPEAGDNADDAVLGGRV